MKIVNFIIILTIILNGHINSMHRSNQRGTGRGQSSRGQMQRSSHRPTQSNFSGRSTSRSQFTRPTGGRPGHRPMNPGGIPANKPIVDTWKIPKNKPTTIVDKWQTPKHGPTTIVDKWGKPGHTPTTIVDKWNTGKGTKITDTWYPPNTTGGQGFTPGIDTYTGDTTIIDRWNPPYTETDTPTTIIDRWFPPTTQTTTVTQTPTTIIDEWTEPESYSEPETTTYSPADTCPFACMVYLKQLVAQEVANQLQS